MLRVDEDAGVGVLEVDVSDGDGIVGKLVHIALVYCVVDGCLWGVRMGVMAQPISGGKLLGLLVHRVKPV